MSERDRPIAAEGLQVCPGGPALVRAPAVVLHDGTTHVTDRPVCAVCRCGATSRAPWCDGTHKLLPAERRPGPQSVATDPESTR